MTAPYSFAIALTMLVLGTVLVVLDRPTEGATLLAAGVGAASFGVRARRKAKQP